MIPLSVLDTSPVSEGSSAAQSFRNTLEIAQQAERQGFNRYWVAEHHNMPGIASAATSVLMSYIANGTSTIRVGAGGIMLPNHSPLVIAEQFGTLASLFPGRIDLGLGRAPGSDGLTARALRRNMASDTFPQDVVELLNYFKPAAPGQRVRAVPGEGLNVPVWILGSSTFGAQLAAKLGLPYGFASHFAPAQLERAIALYHEQFQPSEYLQEPYVMLGVNVIAAETDEEANYLFTTLIQDYVNLHRGNTTKLQPPVNGYADNNPEAQAVLRQVLSCSVVGSPEVVSNGIRALVEKTGADELMVSADIFDHEKRLRSYEIVGQLIAP